MEAEESKEKHQETMVQPILTEIKKADIFYNAEDYHQKFMLRRFTDVLDSLNLTNEQLITSPLASKLNGYLGGYGDLKTFEEVCEDLKPTQKIKSIVQKRLSHRL